MEVIPSVDLTDGRSRIVSWPGASTGAGVPTDRPERIVERFVADGARVVHLVDVDGARAGVPVNLEAVGRIAATIAVPIQLAGGLEQADHIRLAFAAGATRVVLGMEVIDDPDRLRECLAVAGDWLAVGLDPRPERLAAFARRRPIPATMDGIVALVAERGVARVVLSHGGGADVGALVRAAHGQGLDVLVAGGIGDTRGIERLRDVGVDGVILGEPLLSGAIPYPAALEAAA
jgi:phosphoribosylformimino-5-aminoimidazole carboxamide ribotide isomerase